MAWLLFSGILTAVYRIDFERHEKNQGKELIRALDTNLAGVDIDGFD